MYIFVCVCVCVCVICDKEFLSKDKPRSFTESG